jgi:hypothetical protein
MKLAPAALAIALLAAAHRGAAAEAASDARLSVDPHVSIETGADATRTFAALIARLETDAFRPLEGRRFPGVAARSVRTVLFDLPLAWWLGVLEHEAFGHGGRAREVGARAGFHMGSPWGGRDSYASFSTEGLGIDDVLRIYAGGTESNSWTAILAERDLVAGRPMSSLELLLVAANRWVDYAYVVRTTPDPARDPAGFYGEWTGGGDVANYLGRLIERDTGDPGITPGGSSRLVRDNYRRLRRQAVWSVLDPGLWLSLWTAGRAVLDGDAFPRVPLPSYRGRALLPLLSADWLPDGGVASLEIVLGPARGVPPVDAAWSSLVARAGAGPRGRIIAAGAATDRLLALNGLKIGGEIEAWRQPTSGVGGGVRARFTALGGRMRGVFAEAGVKTAGHWPGRPAGTGAFASLGVSIPLP